MPTTVKDLQKRNTPWGRSLQVDAITPGVTFHTTASHGGIHLSPDRESEFYRRCPGFVTTAGGPWFEEDCDQVAVIVILSEHFSAETVQRAMAYVFDLARTSRKWEEVLNASSE